MSRIVRGSRDQACADGSDTEMANNLSYIKKIRDLRIDSDKTQQEIADVLQTSQTMYARYERGANEMPIHHLLKLCEYYGVTSDYILGIEKPGED